MKKISVIIVLIAIIASLITMGVLRTPQKTSDIKNLTVATSFYPLYEFSKHVGGDKIKVINLTPPGVEPHDYEPAPRTLADTQNSKVFIYNGGSMEPWVDKFLPDYKNIAVKASQNIALLPIEEGSDPHFWLDPHAAGQIVRTIQDALIQADPNDKDYFAENAAAYIAELQKLDTDYKNGLAVCHTRTIVTSHAAFSYVAHRYNLEVIAIAGINPEAEPSPAKLAEITTLIKEKAVRSIFFESLVSPRLADTIAQETGATTAVFDPIEGLSDEDQKQGKNYISVQRDNLAALRSALSCQ